MKLIDFLSKDRIAPDLAATSKEEVLGELASLLVSAGAVEEVEAVVRVLLEREKLGSTGIGEGIAIPHGKLKELRDVVAAFGRSSRGIDFDSMDGAPVHLFFLLLAPENSASAHLKALARISRLLKEKAFRESLIRASSRDSLYDLMIEEDEKR
jgi:nitrogen PTS system EIIA component